MLLAGSILAPLLESVFYCLCPHHLWPAGRWKGHATGRGAHKDAGEGMIDALQFGGQNRVVEVQQLSGGEAWRAGSAHQEPTGGSPFGDSLNAWRRRSEGKPEGSGDLFSSHQIASGQGHAGRAQQEPLVPSYSQDQPRRPQQMVSIQSERRAHENRRQTPPNVWLSRPVWGEAADGTPPPEVRSHHACPGIESPILNRNASLLIPSLRSAIIVLITAADPSFSCFP